MRVVAWSVITVGFLSGCATSHPYVQPSPIPSEVGWTAPVVEPLEEPPAPVVTIPERKASPSEQVFTYDEGKESVVKVSVQAPLVILLQEGEIIDQVIKIREPHIGGEEKPPWEIQPGISHTPARPNVSVTVTTAGLSTGLTVTTNRRIYLLDLRSVAASKVKLVRFDYGPEPVKKVASKPRLLPDLSQAQTFYGGYVIDPVNKDRVPSWTPRQAVNDQQGKTYLVFPTYMTSIQAPLLRLIGSTGPEVINYRQVGTTYILDGLFNLAELRVGTGAQAEVVRIYRGIPQAMRCPGDAACPVWSDRVAGR
jgi:type IV secretory pathway VirB9-like protein